ncbi:SDR family NAD(P)-dependent oxidoreductase [Bradyrhizobium embrapense]|uniref:SDR family NAD(P)-dependent oxidoreductase n=1 Tax=Bradyrhizobium embrapense TaxID=630921 RepID=UPI000AF48F81|nr:SDR family NAD(P)-dependent oxidoreductase [Bradyrhizobium embrapense]
MRELAGKAAFVTGAASGIGLAMATAFAREGMKVMLADIETGALDKAVDALRAGGADVHGVVCDVADPASLDRAAKASFRAFGNVHVVCNNAGVAAGGGIDPISVDDWRWVIDVNLMGVVHGVRSFLPHIRAHGEGGHIVNTASMAGMNAGLGVSPYSATKFAVVSLSEGLSAQLAPLGIGVSVLCPSYVRTRIGESGRNRPAQYGPARQLAPDSPAAALVAEIARRLEAGLDPASVAARVMRAIHDDQLYVFTIPGCGPRSRTVLRRFWPRWTPFRPKDWPGWRYSCP